MAGELPAQGAHSGLTAKSRDLANRAARLEEGPRQADVAPFPAPVPDYSEAIVDLATLTPRTHLALAAHIRSPGNWLACFTQAAN